MNLIPDAPIPCYAVPDFFGCRGCVFHDGSILQAESRCNQSGQTWRLRDSVDCIKNDTIFIVATPEAVATYQAAFDTHQLKFIIERLLK